MLQKVLMTVDLDAKHRGVTLSGVFAKDPITPSDKYPYRYEVRHKVGDPDTPLTVEPFVLVGRMGYLHTEHKLPQDPIPIIRRFQILPDTGTGYTN